MEQGPAKDLSSPCCDAVPCRTGEGQTVRGKRTGGRREEGDREGWGQERERGGGEVGEKRGETGREGERPGGGERGGKGKRGREERRVGETQTDLRTVFWL